MSVFISMLSQKNKDSGLLQICKDFRENLENTSVYTVSVTEFSKIPSQPFAYWVSSDVRDVFQKLPCFEGNGRTLKQGIATADDFRFVRSWWEVKADGNNWPSFAKGGAFSPFYADLDLVVTWKLDGKEIKNFADTSSGKIRSRPQNTAFYRLPGLTWSDRTTLRLSPRVMPANVVFSVKGSAGFFGDSNFNALGLMNSSAFNYLISLMVGAGDSAAKSYQVGTIGQVPYPGDSDMIAALSKECWSLKRVLDSICETSHAFVLPDFLRSRLEKYERDFIEAQLVKNQDKINEMAFEVYDFSETDRAAANEKITINEVTQSPSDNDEQEIESVESTVDSLISWTVGVNFSRFDWRLATGEREEPPEPEPFDPLPAKSPGMLPDGAEPFHYHAGILVDDEGHEHDLPRLVELVLETVNAPVSQDIRRWLRKDFFPFHLQQYSKSRRKAPIYWPLSTASGSYTLWLYYPELTNQTLFTAVNDFLEGESGKLSLVKQDVAALRNKGSSRTKQEEKELEKLEDLEQELADLRDTLLEIAPNYRPNQDDGVQITAAPLWSLFRHKPWQKVLKDTWKQLEKGDYDWAHLALNYWPDRVLRKCHEDRSLAIAHDVEEQFWEETEVPVIRRGKDTGETKLEWQPKDLSEAQLQAVIVQVRQERSL